MENSRMYFLGAITLFVLSFTTAAAAPRPLLYEIKRLVPSGPNQAESPDSPVNVVELNHYQLSKDPTSYPARISSSADGQFEWGIRGTARSGPSKKPSWELKRLVPSGPNPQTSPESPPKPRS